MTGDPPARSDADEIADLKRRVAELEERAKPQPVNNWWPAGYKYRELPDDSS